MELPPEKPLISIVIPLRHEAGNIAGLLSEIETVLAPTGFDHEFVLVDDGSRDTTWAEISSLKDIVAALQGIRLSRHFGKELALCAGIEHARGEAVVVMDGDGQHPPSLLPEMIRLWRDEGASVVEAVKTDRGRERMLDRFSAWLFYLILNKLSGYDLKGASDFKLLDRKAVEAWLRMPERSVFFRGMTAWLGLKCVQVPFTVPERSSGKSGWSYVRRIKLALTGATAFSSLPLQFVTAMGALFLLFSVALGAQALYLKIVGSAVSGFTTVILLILIVGSLLMISLGIIGTYLARIYEEVKGRPRYVIAELIDTGEES